jgi:hypothetical protein
VPLLLLAAPHPPLVLPTAPSPLAIVVVWLPLEWPDELDMLASGVVEGLELLLHASAAMPRPTDAMAPSTRAMRVDLIYAMPFRWAWLARARHVKCWIWWRVMATFRWPSQPNPRHNSVTASRPNSVAVNGRRERTTHSLALRTCPCPCPRPASQGGPRAPRSSRAARAIERVAAWNE